MCRVIVVDSGKNIEEIVLSFKDRLPIEYYKSEPGQGRQRNLGISMLNDTTSLVAWMDDVAHACEKILINNTYGKKLILAGNKPTTINQLVSILEQINPSIQVSYSKELARKDDYQGDIGNLEETYSLLNWRPSIDLSQGINRLKEYFYQTII